jgi:hypothetical protein
MSKEGCCILDDGNVAALFFCGGWGVLADRT